jgi:hypothetical protein
MAHELQLMPSQRRCPKKSPKNHPRQLQAMLSQADKRKCWVGWLLMKAQAKMMVMMVTIEILQVMNRLNP